MPKESRRQNAPIHMYEHKHLLPIPLGIKWCFPVEAVKDVCRLFFCYYFKLSYLLCWLLTLKYIIYF